MITNVTWLRFIAFFTLKTYLKHKIKAMPNNTYLAQKARGDGGAGAAKESERQQIREGGVKESERRQRRRKREAMEAREPQSKVK